DLGIVEVAARELLGQVQVSPGPVPGRAQADDLLLDRAGGRVALGTFRRLRRLWRRVLADVFSLRLGQRRLRAALAAGHLWVDPLPGALVHIPLQVGPGHKPDKAFAAQDALPAAARPP